MKTLNLLIALVGLVLVAPSHAAEKIYFVHTDHLGTPQALTDDVQNTVWKAGEDPFGDEAPAIELVKNNIRFPGQYSDSESGLHYNWNRYYDPHTGRYVTSDPIGLGGGLNTFGYVGGNPAGRIDPRGEAATIIGGIFVFGAICLGAKAMADGIKGCRKKYPRWKEAAHPDYRAYLICISSVAGIVGLGTGIAVDPLGGAIDGVIDGTNCDGDQCQ